MTNFVPNPPICKSEKYNPHTCDTFQNPPFDEDVINVWFIMTTLRRGAKTIFQLLITSTGLIKKVFILSDTMAKHVQDWQNTRANNKKDKIYAKAGK